MLRSLNDYYVTGEKVVERVRGSRRAKDAERRAAALTAFLRAQVRYPHPSLLMEGEPEFRADEPPRRALFEE